MREVVTFRAPLGVIKKIRYLQQLFNFTRTQVIILALEKLYEEKKS